MTAHKSPSNQTTSEKFGTPFSPLKRQMITTHKSRMAEFLPIDDQRTSHKRSLNFCKNEAEYILK